MRQCSKPGCSNAAVATLTSDYHDSTAVLGPLSTSADPHAFDLCDHHAERLTVPRGWQVVRLQSKFDPAPPSADDLMALVEAVHQVAGRPVSQDAAETWEPVPSEQQWVGSPSGPSQEAPAEEVESRSRFSFTVVPGDLQSHDEPQERAGAARGTFDS